MPENQHRYRFRGHIAPADAKTRTGPRAQVEAGVGVLHIDDVIDSWGGQWGISARDFNAALTDLGDVSSIRLHINSPGGEVWEGIAMLNALRRHPAPVTAVVDALAASAASFIAAGADEVVMGRNSEMMIHDAWGIAMGPAGDMHAMGDRLDQVSNNIASVYAAKSGGTAADWRPAMLAETWYTAEEAVAAGLADRVEAAAQDTGPAAAFDLSVFRHAGRAQAPAPDLIPDADPDADDVTQPDGDHAARFAARRHARNAARQRRGI